MKKTITSLAMLMSATSASALIGPHKPDPSEVRTACLKITHEDTDDSTTVGTCDASANNKKLKLKIYQNGCAANQVAIRVVNDYPEISGCMPVGAIQL